MKQPLAPRGALDANVTPTLEGIDAFCLELRSGLLRGVPGRERFQVELLLREILTNAVVHGLKGKPMGEVRCEIECFADRVTMHVSDTGEGFDWRPRLHASAAPYAESGRGMEILRLYSSNFEFNCEGNGITVTKLFEEGERNG